MEVLIYKIKPEIKYTQPIKSLTVKQRLLFVILTLKLGVFFESIVAGWLSLSRQDNHQSHGPRRLPWSLFGKMGFMAFYF